MAKKKKRKQRPAWQVAAAAPLVSYEDATVPASEWLDGEVAEPGERWSALIAAIVAVLDAGHRVEERGVVDEVRVGYDAASDNSYFIFPVGEDGPYLLVGRELVDAEACEE